MASILNELIDIAEYDESQIFNVTENLAVNISLNEIEEDIATMEKTLTIMDENIETKEKAIADTEDIIENLIQYRNEVGEWIEEFMSGNDLSEQNETKMSVRELDDRLAEIERVIEDLRDNVIVDKRKSINKIKDGKEKAYKIIQALKIELERREAQERKCQDY